MSVRPPGRLLKISFERRDPDLIRVGSDPLFRPLRANPHFLVLLDRLKGGESDARWTLTAELSEPSRVIMPRGCKTRDVRDRDAPRGRFARTVRSYFEPKS
jgi:hypothetical protein